MRGFIGRFKVIVKGSKESNLLQRGFTLIEMTFVLLILGVLGKIAIQPLAKLQEHRARQSTEIQLQTIRQSIFAYLVSYGRLPCPIDLRQPFADRLMTPYLPANDRTNNAYSDQSACTHGVGAVPAYQLGLHGPTDQTGALLDAWGERFRYAVSLDNHADAGNIALPDWTTTGEAASVGVARLRAGIVLCHRVVMGGCKGADVRADQIAFVVLSLGADKTIQGEQTENQDDDEFFLIKEQDKIDNQEFDDQLLWGTAADTIYWLLRIGWLP